MLRVDLVRLEREGALQVEGVIGPQDPVFEGSGIRLGSPLRVSLRASFAGSGEVVVRGSVRGELEQECRRCLAKLTPTLDSEVTFVFAPADALGGTEEADLYPLEPGATHLDLSGPLREELMLTVSGYAFCDEDCKGLCSGCGVDLNEEECRCVKDEVDPRWDVLRALKTE